ncbi:hypothetical protein OHA74_29980 [Streptomyces phaeochromogenes]|uniref:DUF4760 domain-containing protein n=1 Tax=Streptomyces phaeochromogenes TaxID=1923 RepID=UPI002E2A0FAD|nr:hypothetical protein [Streptomyces phaeochromogenes]
MESSLALNVLVLLVSIATLITSLVVARRQLRLAHNSNVLPIIIDMFKDTREPEFSRSIEYLLSEFTGQYPHEDGYLNLPPEPKAHIRRVALFLDDAGKLVAHGVVDERIILGSYAVLIARTWETLAPYVYSERARQGNFTMIYLEDLAARARSTPASSVHAALGLRRLPPVE